MSRIEILPREAWCDRLGLVVICTASKTRLKETPEHGDQARTFKFQQLEQQLFERWFAVEQLELFVLVVGPRIEFFVERLEESARHVGRREEKKEEVLNTYNAHVKALLREPLRGIS
jgi:hypothetical protein